MRSPVGSLILLASCTLSAALTSLFFNRQSKSTAPLSALAGDCKRCGRRRRLSAPPGHGPGAGSRGRGSLRWSGSRPHPSPPLSPEPRPASGPRLLDPVAPVASCPGDGAVGTNGPRLRADDANGAVRIMRTGPFAPYERGRSHQRGRLQRVRTPAGPFASETEEFSVSFIPMCHAKRKKVSDAINKV